MSTITLCRMCDSGACTDPDLGTINSSLDGANKQPRYFYTSVCTMLPYIFPNIRKRASTITSSSMCGSLYDEIIEEDIINDDFAVTTSTKKQRYCMIIFRRTLVN